MSEEEHTVRIIPFSGKKHDWPVWSGNFCANARVKGYFNVLTGVESPPNESTVIDTSTDAGKEDMRKRKANETAYNALIQLMTTTTTFQKIDNAKTTDLPNGDAARAWESLVKKYEPDNLTIATNFEKEFLDMFMESVTIDPEDYVEGLLTKRMLIKRSSNGKFEINDDKLLRHVLTSLPEEYDDTVKSLKKMYSDRTLNIDSLTDELSETFSMLEHRRKQRETKEDKDDLALMTMMESNKVNEDKINEETKPEPTITTSTKGAHMQQVQVQQGQMYQQPYQQPYQQRYPYPPRPFKGMCQRCGQIGHRAAECTNPNPPKNLSYAQTQMMMASTGAQTNPPMIPLIPDGNGGLAPNPGYNRRFTGNCLYCGKVGHKATDCRLRVAHLAAAQAKTIPAANPPIPDQAQMMSQLIETIRSEIKSQIPTEISQPKEESEVENHDNDFDPVFMAFEELDCGLEMISKEDQGIPRKINIEESSVSDYDDLSTQLMENLTAKKSGKGSWI